MERDKIIFFRNFFFAAFIIGLVFALFYLGATFLFWGTCYNFRPGPQAHAVILGVNGIRLLGKRSGVGRCIEAVLQEIPKLDHPFREIRLYTPAPIPDVFPPPIRPIVLPSRAPLAWSEQYVLLRAHGQRDPVLCPSYVVPLLARCRTLVIHHGSYEGYPKGHAWWGA